LFQAAGVFFFSLTGHACDVFIFISLGSLEVFFGAGCRGLCYLLAWVRTLLRQYCPRCFLFQAAVVFFFSLTGHACDVFRCRLPGSFLFTRLGFVPFYDKNRLRCYFGAGCWCLLYLFLWVRLRYFLVLDAGVFFYLPAWVRIFLRLPLFPPPMYPCSAFLKYPPCAALYGTCTFLVRLSRNCPDMLVSPSRGCVPVSEFRGSLARVHVHFPTTMDIKRCLNLPDVFIDHYALSVHIEPTG